MNQLDFEMAESFDLQNPVHWLLIAAIVGMLIYGYWVVRES